MTTPPFDATPAERVATFPNVEPPAAVRSSDVLVADAEKQSLRVTIPRCTSATPNVWPDPASHVALYVFSSDDDGATWKFHVGCTDSGGIQMGEDGQERAVAHLESRLPRVRSGARRRLKVCAVALNGDAPTLDINVDVE